MILEPAFFPLKRTTKDYEMFMGLYNLKMILHQKRSLREAFGVLCSHRFLKDKG